MQFRFLKKILFPFFNYIYMSSLGANFTIIFYPAQNLKMKPLIVKDKTVFFLIFASVAVKSAFKILLKTKYS